MNMTINNSKASLHGHQAITACAFIHREINGVEKVFLPKRAATKKFMPSVFELPGGHVDFGEDIVAGLKREVAEEFGMAIEVGDPFFAFTYTNEARGTHSIEVDFFATFVEDPKNIKLDPEDHSEYDWFAEDELVNAASEGKGPDNIEFVAMRKGFALLRGESPKF